MPTPVVGVYNFQASETYWSPGDRSIRYEIRGIYSKMTEKIKVTERIPLNDIQPSPPALPSLSN
ncbi:MAG: hypothetical protein HY692_06515 [Cyanobacteria bacterium NC_groundwater_1444_Ag_S-0.65um_54_12]|nr:hypothetical protein [Cyanobacteria bacterium NC_groundwater_1444_Ag_S-0.65um_54_12]